ncbi:hypothetical protein BG011_007718, partial [Mortierella polycephala]
MSHYLSQSLGHISDQATMTLYSIKKPDLGSSQTVIQPDQYPIADTVKMTLRASSIGSNTVDLEFYYDPYDWSFPPDLIIHGMLIKPSLEDLGLDESWDYEDPANLSKVLSKLAHMMQHDERQRVALCDNERIQIEYTCLSELEARHLSFDLVELNFQTLYELDCFLIPGLDGPTKVVFAVPFYVPYTHQGEKQEAKIAAKIQFTISSLIPNDVIAVQSKIEVLSSFEYPEILHDIADINKQEPITQFVDRVSRRITDHFERLEQGQQFKKEFIETLVATFRKNLMECDVVHYTFASFMFMVPKDRSRPDIGTTAIATFYVPDTFPDDYPKLTLTAPVLPHSTYTSTPSPEVIPISRYSPRWDAERIVTEIWEQLWDEIPRYHARLSSQAAAS